MTGLVLADGWRAAFLAGSAPVVGSGLLLAIATLTGASWPAAERAWRWLPLVALAAAGLGLAQVATPPPPHLAGWLHPLAVAARGVAAPLALWGGLRIVARDRSPTAAGVTLAVFAALVTPLASDWMLGQVPGHAVSAAGMMLVCQQIATGCALPLALGTGGERERRDLARLMVAASLGLGYLLFVDYLIVWFGNLPAHVGFYADRNGLATTPLLAALLLGWAVPVARLPFDPADRRRIASGGVLAAALLADLWWVGGGALAALLAVAVVALGGGGAWLAARRTAHG